MHHRLRLQLALHWWSDRPAQGINERSEAKRESFVRLDEQYEASHHVPKRRHWDVGVHHAVPRERFSSLAGSAWVWRQVRENIGNERALGLPNCLQGLEFRILWLFNVLKAIKIQRKTTVWSLDQKIHGCTFPNTSIWILKTYGSTAMQNINNALNHCHRFFCCLKLLHCSISKIAT